MELQVRLDRERDAVKKKGGGKHSDTTRCISVWLTPVEINSLEVEAKRRGVTRSIIIREKLRKKD